MKRKMKVKVKKRGWVPGVEDEHAMLEAVLGEGAGEAVLDGVLGIVARERVGVVPLVVELDADHAAGSPHVADLRVLVLELHQQLRQLFTASLSEFLSTCVTMRPLFIVFGNTRFKKIIIIK